MIDCGVRQHEDQRVEQLIRTAIPQTQSDYRNVWSASFRTDATSVELARGPFGRRLPAPRSEPVATYAVTVADVVLETARAR